MYKESKTSQSAVKKRLYCALLMILACTACTEQQTGALNLGSAGGQNARIQALKPQAVMILQQGLNSPSAKIRTHAIEVAAETGQKETLGTITKLTTDSIVPVRFAAVVALGDMKCGKCEQTIRKSLNDPDVNVRIAASYSLVKLGKKDYVAQLLAATKSTDQTVRANAALLIGKLDNPDHIPLLYEVMTAQDSVTKVRMQAVESIARLGDERMYRSKLWALQISKFADDRVMGIRGMGALNSQESREAIQTMLQDDIVEVRLAAAEQLARLGDFSGEEEVWTYFQGTPDLNKADIANGMAVMAIGHLQTDRLNAYLGQALNSQNPYIQLLAAQSVLIQVK